MEISMHISLILLTDQLLSICCFKEFWPPSASILFVESAHRFIHLDWGNLPLFVHCQLNNCYVGINALQTSNVDFDISKLWLMAQPFDFQREHLVLFS